MFEVKRIQFPSLEKLYLDKNDLTELSTFSSLAGLPRLRYLNLEGNQISSVPHLRLMGAQVKPPNLHHMEQECEDDVEFVHGSKETDYQADDENDEDQQLNNILNNSLQNLTHSVNDIDVSLQKVGLKRRATSNLTESNFALENVHQANQPPLPFGRLEHLNIANNIIVEEEGLLSLGSWPSLRELEIWGNPLTTAFRGDPPIIAIELGVMKGIHIIRKKPGTVTKPLLAPLRQTVKDELPAALRRKAKLLALEGPHKSPEVAYVGQHLRPLPPISTAPADALRDRATHMPRKTATAPPRTKDITQSQQSSAWTTPPPERAITPEGGKVKTEAEPTGGEASSKQEGQRQTQARNQDDGFFLTQVGVVGEEKPQQKKPLHKRHKHKKHYEDGAKGAPRIPHKYKGYEELLDIEEVGADLIVPKDIQGSVRALQYALDHPLVFSEPTLDMQQARRQSKKKKVTSSQTMSSKTSKVEQLGSLLDKMRLQSKIIENSLEDVLRDYNTNAGLRRQYPEVKKLLKEVQAKYDEVRFTSMKSAQQVQNSLGEITKSVARIKPEKSSEQMNSKKVTYDDETEEKLLKLKEQIESRI